MRPFGLKGAAFHDAIIYIRAEINAAQGMVSIQAHTIWPATPHRTAANRLMAPTPKMEPVMVWVVLTGTPRKEEKKSVEAAAVSAQKPSTGRSFVIF
jgi:hypothetical protein